MDTLICPKGHPSTEPDFCSECGAKIAEAPAPPSLPPPQPASETCPDCGANRAADGSSFCEVCGYNFATRARGELPVAAAEPQPGAWTLSVAVDPSLREPGSPEPPAGIGPFVFHLDKPVSLIGRKSESRAIFPEIPLNFDEAVSHRHALIQRGGDGALVLRDIGAANGTRLNGEDVEALVDVPLKDGDRITLGHWTRITVQAVR